MEKKVGSQREEGFFSNAQCRKLTGRLSIKGSLAKVHEER
jgi:hypothetical protein